MTKVSSKALYEMAPVVGIEPTLRVLETLVLPLYDTDMAEGVGFEPTEPLRFAHLANVSFRPLSQPSIICQQTLVVGYGVYHHDNIR